MKKSSILWIIIGIGAALFLLLMLLSDVIATGEKIGKINEYLEYGFYILSALLFYILILNPIRIILFSPSFSIVTVLDEENKRNFKVYKKIAKNLIDNNYIPEEDIVALQSSENINEIREELTRVFNSSIKKDINRIIARNAKTVLISTAICQNGKLDMLTVLTMNIKMIKEIVLKCGFRPGYVKLGKLSVNVITTALIAESLEGLDFNDLFPQTTANIFAEVPLIKPIASSFLNGISNALLTIRIGIITRKYLFSDGKLTKQQIRISAIKESLQMLPGIIKDVMTFIPSKIAKLFTKKEKESVNVDEI